MSPPTNETSDGEPITFGSSISLNLLENPSFYAYSEGFLIRNLVVKSFEERGNNMRSDFNYCSFKILPFSSSTNFKTQTAFVNDLILNIDQFSEKSYKIQK